MRDPSRFYDDLAELYDLIYEDWEASMDRQGRAIDCMLSAGAGGRPVERVLDVAAGIGTQSLPLARLGYEIVARDLSAAAVARLGREAAARGLEIDARPADMRSVAESVDGDFDAVIAFDNSIPHLQTDEEIESAMREFFRLLRSGGLFLLSVRDYAAVDRTATSRHPYGIRTRGGRSFRLAQEWSWADDEHYRTILTVEERETAEDGTDRTGESDWMEVMRTETQYYAVSVDRLLELMEATGFTDCGRSEEEFYQPVLVGRRG